MGHSQYISIQVALNVAGLHIHQLESLSWRRALCFWAWFGHEFLNGQLDDLGIAQENLLEGLSRFVLHRGQHMAVGIHGDADA